MDFGDVRSAQRGPGFQAGYWFCVQGCRFVGYIVQGYNKRLCVVYAPRVQRGLPLRKITRKNMRSFFRLLTQYYWEVWEHWYQ